MSNQIRTTEENVAELKTAAELRAAADADVDAEGGYLVVRDILPNLVEGELNRLWGRGWKLVTTFRGHGGENLVFFKAAA